MPVEIIIITHKIGWNAHSESIGHQKNTAEASARAYFII
ncbi:hypothetical protein J2741_000275 [Methanolinea mesophila]|nr:hypothetical protein [Methanolinea mesophila]